MPRNVHRLFSPIRKLLCTVSEAGDVSRSVLILRLENTEDLRWMAILLDKTPPQAVPSVGGPPPSDRDADDASARGIT